MASGLARLGRSNEVSLGMALGGVVGVCSAVVVVVVVVGGCRWVAVGDGREGAVWEGAVVQGGGWRWGAENCSKAVRAIPAVCY